MRPRRASAASGVLQDGRESYKTRARRRLRAAPAAGRLALVQDPHYKRLFSFPRMVEDLLRGFLPGEVLAEVDFSTLDKLPAEYVSDALLRRHGDCVWRVRRRGRWLYLLVLLEFQSTEEARMALRILGYTSLQYQELVRTGALDAGGRLPAVLPVVLYNGEARWGAAVEVGELIAPVGPWLAPYQPSQRYLVVDEQRVGADDLPGRNLMAAVSGLERSRGPEDLLRVAEQLAQWLRDPRDEGLKRAFTDWVWRLAGQCTPGGSGVAGGADVGGSTDDAGRTVGGVAEAVAPARPRGGGRATAARRSEAAPGGREHDAGRTVGGVAEAVAPARPRGGGRATAARRCGSCPRRTRT